MGVSILEEPPSIKVDPKDSNVSTNYDSPDISVPSYNQVNIDGTLVVSKSDVFMEGNAMNHETKWCQPPIVTIHGSCQAGPAPCQGMQLGKCRVSLARVA